MLCPVTSSLKSDEIVMKQTTTVTKLKKKKQKTKKNPINFTSVYAPGVGPKQREFLLQYLNGQVKTRKLDLNIKLGKVRNMHKLLEITEHRLQILQSLASKLDNNHNNKSKGLKPDARHRKDQKSTENKNKNEKEVKYHKEEGGEGDEGSHQVPQV